MILSGLPDAPEDQEETPEDAAAPDAGISPAGPVHEVRTEDRKESETGSA